jgi:hypothetical protein
MCHHNSIPKNRQNVTITLYLKIQNLSPYTLYLHVKLRHRMCCYNSIPKIKLYTGLKIDRMCHHNSITKNSKYFTRPLYIKIDNICHVITLYLKVDKMCHHNSIYLKIGKTCCHNSILKNRQNVSLLDELLILTICQNFSFSQKLIKK